MPRPLRGAERGARLRRAREQQGPAGSLFSQDMVSPPPVDLPVEGWERPSWRASLANESSLRMVTLPGLDLSDSLAPASRARFLAA